MNEFKNIFIQELLLRKEKIMKKENQPKFTVKTIAGVCLILISILVILYGWTLFPFSFGNVDFMSFLVGGMIGIVMGLCMISGIARVVKQGVILIAGMILSGYCFLFDMDLLLKLIATVCIMGIAFGLVFWMSTKEHAGNTIKICKKCSAVSPQKLEQFAAENGYNTKYGCIGKCAGSCNQKQYVGLQNGQVILADSEREFFEKLKK